MSRSIFALVVAALGGCSGAMPADPDVAQQSLGAASPAGTTVDSLRRDHLSGDVYHYQLDLHVGTTANAVLRIHRVVRELAPWVPIASRDAVMMLHGDFSTFGSTFVPGLAGYLAARDIDVWGFDRRWTHAPAGNADTSDFAAMGFAAELDDIGRALAFARAARVITGSGAGRLTLIGFSRGGHLAYGYAAREGANSEEQRHVKALVPLDVYAELAPDDAFGRATACANADAEKQALAGGVFDNDNSVFVLVGNLAATAPDQPSPVFTGLTNRQAFLTVVGQTYQLFAPTPLYHLLAGTIQGGAVTGLRETREAVGEAWFAGGAPHQSMREVAESDALWCGRAPLPLAIDLSRITVPLYFLGAAAGFGDAALYSTTRVRSRDVTRHIVRRFGADRVAEDFGHADLLFAADAPALAWRSLATWIARR